MERRPPLWLSVPLAAGLALMVTSRAWEAPASRAAGQTSVDGLGSWWFQWWVARSVAQGEGLGHTDLLFYPWGKAVLRDTGANFVDALLAAPVQLAFGGVWAWNLLYVAILVSNGVAGAALGRRTGTLGLVAGTVLTTLHPYVLYELQRGRPTQAMLAPMCLAILWAERGLREGGRSVVVAGVLLALTGWTYWFAGLFAGLAIGVVGLGAWRRLAGIGGIALLGVSPVLWQLVRQLLAGETPGVLPVASWWTDQDLVGAQGDPVRLCVLDWNGAAGFIGKDGWSPEGVALGLGALLAALLAPGRWRWVSLGAVVLAVGPWPWGVLNPVYVALANVLPPMARLYWPVRALALLVPLAAMGARSRFGAAAAVLLFVEAAARGPLLLDHWSPATPAPIAALATEEGAMLSLPYGRDQWALVHQSAHGRPLFNGMHERFRFLVPDEQRRMREGNAFVAALLLAPQNPAAEPEFTPEEAQAFFDLGYRWVALRTEPLLRSPVGVERTRHVVARLTQMLGPPHRADDDAVVWRLVSPAPR